MSNREFNKKFEEILKDLFGDRFRPITPLESFFDKIRIDDLPENLDDWKSFIKKSKDGIFTSIIFFNPESGFKKSNENPHQKVVNALQKELDECIKEQDFERAAILRDEIKNLTKNKSKIVELQKELDYCIKEQNFERAIEIRDELKKIN
jgi:excinuclease UvrABC helicase subunit UvrB